jgi:hypothetical protein
MEQANDGSAQAGNPDGARSAAENGSAADAGNSSWVGLLSDADNRSLVEKKGWKNPDDPLKSYRELESRMGSALTVPAPDAKPEAWDSFYAKVGRPEKPDGYEYKRPEGLPENVPYDDKLASWSKGVFHKAGLTARQAQVVHDEFARQQAERAQAYVAERDTALTKKVEETHAALTKEWGPEESPGFKTKVELANRAIKKLGLLESFKQSGIVLPDGALTDPALAKAFAIVGEKQFADDTLDGEAASGGDNPFKPKNLTAISLLIKSDPDKARMLCREAGLDPDQWVGRKR